MPSTSAVGSSTTPFDDDDGLLPGFESTPNKPRPFSGEDSKSFSSRMQQQQQRSDPPLIRVFYDPTPSSSPPPSSSSAFEDDGLLPGFSFESVKSRAFGEATRTSSPRQDPFGSLDRDEPPVSSSIPSGSPFEDVFNVFSEPRVPPSASSSRMPSGSPPFDDVLDVFIEPKVPPSATSSSRAAARGCGVSGKVDRNDSLDSFPQSPANSSYFNDSSSGKQPAEDLSRTTSRSADDVASNAWEGISGVDISRVFPDSDPSFSSSKTERGKCAAAAVTIGSSHNPDEEKAAAWDSPTSVAPLQLDRGGPKEGSHRSRKEMKGMWVTVDDLKLSTQPSQFPPLRRPPPWDSPGSGGSSFGRDKSDTWDAEFITSSVPSTSTPDVDLMGNNSSVAVPPSHEHAVLELLDFNIEPNVDGEKGREEAREIEERMGQETEAAKAAQERDREPSQQTDDNSDDDLESFFGHSSTSAREPSQQKDHKSDDDLESFFGHSSTSAGEPFQQKDHKNDDYLESLFGHSPTSSWEPSQQMHQKSDDDLDSFFGHSTPSAPSQRQKPAPMNSSSNVFGKPRPTASATATFSARAAPSSDVSQDNRRGDTGKISRGKNDRLAHTRENAANAVAEIRLRDLELQRDQTEKRRAGDVLDPEIKRWAAGKEGNLRALLCTLQDVLWPECGWTPVSLTDLINPASVKKTYRKATLYVHPDKVQQKGATAQQKYIAEKVFDLLKEAFSKFNSQELF